MIKTASFFTQILALVDRSTFAQVIKHHKAGRYAKGFSCWEQFVAMLFSQLVGANSLREISGGLASAGGKLVHPKLRKSPARSTLSFANEHRPWQVYQELFEHLLVQCRQRGGKRKRKFQFKNPLISLDIMVIDLCLSL